MIDDEKEKRPAERVLALIDSEPWLITTDGLAKIREIAARENFVISVGDLAKIEERREVLAAKKAARIAGTATASIRDGVAIIDVVGPIFRYADIFTSVSGGATVEAIAADFNAAMEDPRVEAVLLNIDSPGGEAKGINELANMIASRRGSKPIGSYIGGNGGSGGYWIAVAAEPGLVGIDATGFAGSVGAALSVTKERATEKSRTVTFEFISKQSPNKRPDPETEAGRTELQARADALGGAFVDSVAALRGIAADLVLADFGGGRMLMGEEARKAGLVDQVTSMEAMVSQLKERRRTGTYGKTTPRFAASAKENGMYTKEMKVKLGLAETATDAEVDAKIAALQSAETQLGAEKALRIKAEEDAKTAATEKLRVTAIAQVDAWERDGRLTGDSTKEVRDFYVALATGEKVTPEGFAKVIASLPKFDTTRTAKAAKPVDDKEKLSAEDIHAFDRGERDAKVKVDAHVKKLVAADKSKNYVQHLKAARAEALAK